MFSIYCRGGPVYGHDFEVKCTEPTPDTLKGSHRQIVSYKFGDLKFLVRFEVDCADYEKSGPIATNIKSESKDKESNSADALAVCLSKMSLPKAEEKEKLPGSALSVIKLGDRRRYHLVELATRIITGKGVKRPFPVHVWPQMFFSGTETFSLGWQNYGNVRQVEVFPVKVFQHNIFYLNFHSFIHYV